MRAKPTPAKIPAAPSKQGTYGSGSIPGKTQLSSGGGVQSNVSSAAIERGLLSMRSATPFDQAPPVVARTLPAVNDAEIMLRVRAGDDAAFEYLVQKYRRPMVSYMFRMCHNAAAAEDLAQEVFLRVYRSRANYE